MKNDMNINTLADAKLSPDAILADLDVAIPEALDIAQARWITGMSLTALGRMIGEYRVGWEHGQPLRGTPYTRQTISDYEHARKAIGKPFAYAFREWQRAVHEQLPPGVKMLSGVCSLQDIPAGALICFGKIVRCQVCGRLLLAWPTTKYCPPEIDDCRKRARREKRNATTH